MNEKAQAMPLVIPEARLVKSNTLDAGWDLVAQHDYTITADAVTLISTGVYGEIPQGHVGIVKERSSLAKHGLAVRGGVIDAGYMGEIKVCMHMALAHQIYKVQAGDRIAQLVVVPLSNWMPSAVSARGDGGFGSTGR